MSSLRGMLHSLIALRSWIALLSHGSAGPHELRELLEEIARVVRTGTRFRVVLHAERAEMFATDALDVAVVEVQVRDDAAVRMDLGICYKQTNQPEKALAEFQRSAAMAPDQWQPLFNEAIALMDLQRMDEARVIATKLQKMRPDDPEVQKLVATVGGK